MDKKSLNLYTINVIDKSVDVKKSNQTHWIESFLINRVFDKIERHSPTLLKTFS